MLISVTVILYATLGCYHPEGRKNEPFTVKLPAGSRVGDLLKQLDIPPGEAKQVFVEHRSCSGDYLLQDGQKAAVFPAIAGG